MARVTIVKACEWEGLYVDGELICEHHDITMDDLEMRTPLDMEVVSATSKFDEEVLCSTGRFPHDLDDVEIRSTR